MAESASAFAQACAHPTSLPPDLEELAIQACDDADNLNEVMRAYTALEKLVDTSALDDSEALTPSRTELSTLLRLLNEALMSRIGTVNTTVGAVREALQRPVAA